MSIDEGALFRLSPEEQSKIMAVEISKDNMEKLSLMLTELKAFNKHTRFDELPAHRLCKIVFIELKNSECVEWKYVNYMKNIFQSMG
jgi:hypothetical protein